MAQPHTARDEGSRTGSVLRLGVDGRVLDDRYHGIGRVTEALLRGLAGRPDVEVVVFLDRDQRSRRFNTAALTDRIGHRTASFNHCLTSPLQWLSWPRALARADVDAVLFPYSLGAAVVGRTRRFAVVHDCIIESSAAFAPGRLTRWMYLLLTRTVVSRARVITPSRASAEAVHETYGVRRGAIEVVPWGVDPAFRAVPDVPIDAEDAELLEIQGTSLRRNGFLLHVGARRPHKNVLTLVHVLARLPADVRLVLVGPADPRFPDPVPEAARRLGVEHRITHLAEVADDDLIRLYGAARALVYPSLVEGFGLPLLEALSVGCPVIASDIPVFREVSHGAATLVPPCDVAAWTRAITALGDLGATRSLIEQGRTAARDATWTHAVDLLVDAMSRSVA